MTTRSNAEFESKLPKYETTPSEDFKEYLLVWCRRDDCPSHTKDGNKPFLVHRRAFQRPHKSLFKPDVVIHGRPCPYCAKVSTIRR